MSKTVARQARPVGTEPAVIHLPCGNDHHQVRVEITDTEWTVTTPDHEPDSLDGTLCQEVAVRLPAVLHHFTGQAPVSLIETLGTACAVAALDGVSREDEANADNGVYGWLIAGYAARVWQWRYAGVNPTDIPTLTAAPPVAGIPTVTVPLATAAGFAVLSDWLRGESSELPDPSPLGGDLSARKTLLDKVQA